MNPDRRAEIGPHRNPDRNPVARVALASFLAVGTTTYVPPLLEKLASWFPTTPVAEAFTLRCRTGLGVRVNNEAFSKGAQVIVVEDSNGSRIADQGLRVGEEVLVLFEGPSNALKNGRDARQFEYFATNADGRRVSPKKETTVTCDRFEHISSVVEEETQRRETPTPPSRTATPTPGSTPPPSATPTSDRVATLEARLQGMIAQSTRTADDEKLARQARAEGAADAKATIEAERRATETVTKLIKEAEERGRREALVTATPVAGTSGRSGVEINLPAKPPVEGMPDGASLAAVIASMIAVLGLAFDRPNHLRTRLGNTIAFPFKEIRYRRDLRAHNQGLNNGTIPAGTPAPVRGYPGIWGV